MIETDRGLTRRASVIVLVIVALGVAAAVLIPRARTVRLPPPEDASPAPTTTVAPVVGGDTGSAGDAPADDAARDPMRTATPGPSVHDVGDTDCGPECYSEKLDPH